MTRFSYAIKLLCISMGMLIGTTTAFAWGQKGHDTVCAIAERHLTKKAQKQISEILDGKSIVYWANWMDNASHQKDFAYTKTWHYKNIDADETFENASENESGDVIHAINAQIAALESGTMNKEATALSLKMLVHLLGDMHCPMHMGHKSDAGGNRWQVQYFDKGTNLHSVWDSALVESAHNWTYTEWAQQLDRVDKATAEAIVSGDVTSWCKETYEICTDIYSKIPVGSKLSYDEVAYWTPVIEQQFLRAGLRLASILNAIFD